MLHSSTPALRARQRGRTAQQLDHPVRSWQCALAFFMHTVKQSPLEIYERVLPSAHRRAVLDLKLPSIQSTLYSALLARELPAWQAYLGCRASKRGWDPQKFEAGLASFPKSLTKSQRLTQGQLWHLFRLHTNGHLTSARLYKARQVTQVQPCPLCGIGDDTARHYFVCPMVVTAFATFEGALPAHVTNLGGQADLFFQGQGGPAHVHLTVAVFTAAWACRGAVLRSTKPPQGVVECIARGVDHPWLLSGLSLPKKDRRAARLRPPPDEPSHAGHFKWDGGFDKGPSGALVAAWGAAWWDVDASNADPPDATASGVLADPATSNMAEFTGLRACLRRALRHPRPRLVFEGDSMLVVMMMTGKWGCHREHLRILLDECRELAERLSSLGSDCVIRHIFREYNTVTDGLAGQAIQAPWSAGASPTW